MEAHVGRVDDLHALALLDSQVHQTRLVHQVCRGEENIEHLTVEHHLSILVLVLVNSQEAIIFYSMFECARTSERLERHELVVGLRGPRVQLDVLLERHEQEADALEAHHLKVNAALKFTHVRPAVTLVHLQPTCNVLVRES